MKLYLKLFATLILVIINIIGLRVAFFLLNESNDIPIIIAILGLFGFGIFDYEFYKRVWRRNKVYVDTIR